MRAAQHTTRTKPLRLETGRASLDAEFLRQPVCGNHDAITAPATADPHRPPLQLRIKRDFTTGEERISVNVQNAIVAGAHRQETRYSIVRRRPYRVVHRPSLPHPLGQYLSNQKTLTAVTNARFASLHGLPVALLPSRRRPFHSANPRARHERQWSGRNSGGLPSAARRRALRSGCVSLCASLRLRSTVSRSPTADRSHIRTHCVLRFKLSCHCHKN